MGGPNQLNPNAPSRHVQFSDAAGFGNTNRISSLALTLQHTNIADITEEKIEHRLHPDEATCHGILRNFVGKDVSGCS